jgi:hypothetical protein
LSTIALASKAFLNLTTQAYDVRGLMYLQAALRGKSYPLASGETGLVEEAAHEGQIVPEGRLPRRGIVTGKLEGRRIKVMALNPSV